ncbi:MAG: hypothetical protein MUF10_18160 [Thermoanaerobaculaceae bacterium]|nr:hypothetical protein [Thermoanaerobaculaceae bacterium]
MHAPSVTRRHPSVRAWPRVLACILGLGLAAAAVAEDPGGAAGTAPRSPRRHLQRQEQVQRLRCLYNGYLLTVDPVKAMAAASAGDRHRLWVLHAVLVHPQTGRIAGIYPALGTPAFAGGPVARDVASYQVLATSETPPAPGITAAQLKTYWRQAGVPEALLAGAEWVDLGGAVATPGLTDTHFHVSSWSKKVPAPGERFGYYADLSDPGYYVIPGEWTRTCARDALWRIVADANAHLIDTQDDGIFLHGYILTEVDSGPSGEPRAAYVYSPSATCTPPTPNPAYLPNRVGARQVTVPPNVCTADASTWPAIDYPMVPALVVQTSGQSCWYNAALLDGYNLKQEQIGSLTPPVPLTAAVTTGSADGATWTLTATSDTAADVLFTAPTPYPLDVVVTRSGESGTLTVPFDVLSAQATSRTLIAQAMIPELATTALAGQVTGFQARPFYRRIAECIPKATWDAAAAYWGESPGTDTVGYGSWDPRNPYATNWYNGAKRGLIQYFFDTVAQAWRPTGYAEHYPMRDALATVVVSSPSVADIMTQARNTAAWCHRHGLTLANDIMFYRRDGEASQFRGYQALSYDHAAEAGFNASVGLDPGVATGDLNLRIGMYYYIESGDDVAETLRLGHDATNGSDLDRLKPASSHPEYPGWVRWLGWKLQLDGAAYTRNNFTNAPAAKITRTDPVTVANELGNQVNFMDHSFGLLTMTDLQEQVLTSRESAALYWFIREADPSSQFHNPQITRDWTAFKKGVVGFLGVSFESQTLAADLGKLSRVPLTTAQATQLAGKLVAVVAQVNDAWDRTLSALIRIWFEASRSPSGLPPLPGQTVCHTSGDGGVDLWARAIRQLKQDVESLPTRWEDLPARWKAVVPQDANLPAIRRTFSDERFRMEHLIFISEHLLNTIQGAGGLNTGTTPHTRNAVLSLQPAIMLLDGGDGGGFPVAQELWQLPHTSLDVWRGLPAVPRQHHMDALGTFLANDIPFTINTDPPAMRDPRPALTVVGAVARTPVEIDPTHWADQSGAEPSIRPPDYLVGKVYPPFGLVTGASSNPHQLTVEQALAAMTFWGAYAAEMEREAGALAVPTGSGQPGWFADIVVWRANPLAIVGPGGLTLQTMGRTAPGSDDSARVQTVNAFIGKFLPKITVVEGMTVLGQV